MGHRFWTTGNISCTMHDNCCITWKSLFTIGVNRWITGKKFRIPGAIFWNTICVLRRKIAVLWGISPALHRTSLSQEPFCRNMEHIFLFLGENVVPWGSPINYREHFVEIWGTYFALEHTSCIAGKDWILCRAFVALRGTIVAYDNQLLHSVRQHP